MKPLVWVALGLLVVLHQGFWFRDDGALVFGFLPVGLAYHVGLSLAAAFAWWLAVKYAWPLDDKHDKLTG